MNLLGFCKGNLPKFHETNAAGLKPSKVVKFFQNCIKRKPSKVGDVKLVLQL